MQKRAEEIVSIPISTTSQCAIDELQEQYKYCVAIIAPPNGEYNDLYVFSNDAKALQQEVSETLDDCWESIYPHYLDYIRLGEERFKEEYGSVWEEYYEGPIEDFGFPVEFGGEYPYCISRLLLSFFDGSERSVRISNKEAYTHDGDNLDWYENEGFITAQQKESILLYCVSNKIG